MTDIAGFVRDIPDFPEPGVVFKDISPLLADHDAFWAAIDAMAAPWAERGVDYVVGIEARGFIFGPPIAGRLGIGFVPVRKPGKLPAETTSMSYELEYGIDTVEIHTDSLQSGDRVVIVDDVLATGGTLDATASLVRSIGAEPVGLGVLIELEFLAGRDRLAEYELHAVIGVP